MLNTLFIAVGLAMDAFAVATTSGMALKKSNLKTYLTFGLYFGFFQSIMPIIGYYGSGLFADYFAEYTPIISFVLLFFIGSKMLYEAIKGGDEEKASSDEDILKPSNLIMLGIATSIDALAVGVLFQINGENIYINSLIIGLVAFIFSSVGVYLGKKVGNLFGNKSEILGGVILIFLGFKFLLM